MIMSALLEEHYSWIWPVMLFASAGVVEHAGVKIPYFAFFAHDSGKRVSEPPVNMLIAMGIGAVACVAIGVRPQLLYDILPYANEYEPYTLTHVLTQLQLLFFAIGAVVAFQMWKIYPAEIPSINLDFDWFYRRLAPRVIRGVGGAVQAADRSVRELTLSALNRVFKSAFRHHGPWGAMARTWPTGSMVTWVTILLAAFLVFYFFGVVL